MKNEQRKSQFKGILLTIIPTASAFFLEAVAFFAYLAVTAIYKGLTSVDLTDAGPMFLIKYILFLLIFGWFYFILITNENETDNEDSKKALNRKQLLYAAFVTAAAGALIGFISYELPGGSAENSVFTAIVMIVLGAPAEELLFRGLTFSIAKEYFRPITAIILQALMYGIFQFSLLQGLGAFALGILLGFAYEKLASMLQKKEHALLYCILFHMAVNAIFYLLNVS